MIPIYPLGALLPKGAWTRRVVLTLALLIAAVCAHPAGAQIPAAPAAATPEAEMPAPEEIGRLVGALESPERRAELVNQLRALQAAQTAADADQPPEGLGTRLLTALSFRLDAVGEQVSSAGETLLDAPQAVNWIDRQMADPERRATWAWFAAELVLVLVAGHVARWITARALRRPRATLAARPPGSAAAKIPLLLLRAAIDVLPVAAFAVAGFGALALTEPPAAVRLTGIAFLNASILLQVVLLVSRGVLSPASPNLRLLRVRDETARRLLHWVRTITFILVYGLFLASAGRTLGMPAELHAAVLKLVGLASSVLLIALVLQFRRPVASWLKGEMAPEDAGRIRTTSRTGRLLRGAGRRLAGVWHVIAILYVVVSYGIWALEIDGGFEFLLRAGGYTLLAVAVARLLGRIVDAATRGLRALLVHPGTTPPWYALRAERYIAPIGRFVRVVIGVTAAIVVLDAWGLETVAWLETGTGRRIAASAISILLVVGIALVAWEVMSALIERYLTGTDGNGTPVERSARARTLLPLLRNAFLVILVTMVALTTLSELGMDIGPLLAGAGVIGLAIGFGSQTLVKDVITGLFILFEDTISVGDVVNVGDKGGLVEGITIRTIRLRDFDGTVHTVPFSAVTSISNMTKDFSFYVFNVTVAYNEDVDRVIQVLEQIGREIRADPRFTPLILAPLEIFGVDAFQDSAVLIKARIKTRPIQQWNVGRAFNGLMKKRFAEAGIEIPFPQRTLHFATPLPAAPQALSQPAQAEGRWPEQRVARAMGGD